MSVGRILGWAAAVIAVWLWLAPSLPAQRGSPEVRRGLSNAAAAAAASSNNSLGTSAESAASADETDVLKFRNGDTLHGTLVRMESAAAIRWRSPEAKAELELGTKNLVQLQLAGKPVAGAPHQQALIRLTNGDQFRGDLVSLDAEKLVVETWYAGQLEIPRVLVRSLAPRAGSIEGLYSGPTGLEGWRRSRDEGGWIYRRGAFYSTGNGAIGRDCKLPERSRIEFDLAWRNFPYLQVAFYTDNLEGLSGNCYVLQIVGNNLMLQRLRNGSFEPLGSNAVLDSFPKRTRVHVGIFSDLPRKSFALLLDGVVVKQWVEPGELAGKGTGVLFQSQGQGLLRISNLSVAPWDGELDANPPAAAEKEDLVRFINNDKVVGRLLSINRGEIRLATSYAPLTVPLERAVQIEFNAEKTERARRQSGDVQAAFRDGGTITFALEKLDDEFVTGHSEDFGRARFARAAFRQFRFNLYDEPAPAGDEDDEWGK